MDDLFLLTNVRAYLATPDLPAYRRVQSLRRGSEARGEQRRAFGQAPWCNDGAENHRAIGAAASSPPLALNRRIGFPILAD
jgi:hypothetical protein